MAVSAKNNWHKHPIRRAFHQRLSRFSAAAYTAIVLASLAALSGCSDSKDSALPDSEPTALEQAIESIGGEAALRALDVLQVSASGTRRIAYESQLPDGSVTDVSTYSTIAIFDFSNDNLRLETERKQLFEVFRILFANNFPTFSIVINGQIGHLRTQAASAPPGQIPSHIVAALRTQQNLLNPINYLVKGLRDPGLLTAGGGATFQARPHRIVNYAGEVAPISLYIDSETGLISKLETTQNSLLVRDVTVEVIYTDWQAHSEIMFPHQVDVFVDGALVTEETRHAVVIEPDLPASIFDLPDGLDPVNEVTYAWGQQTHQDLDAIFNIGVYYQENRAAVTTTQLDQNLTLYGRSPEVNINNLVINHSGGVLVLEGGGTGESGDDLVARVEANFPGKHITHLVQSHAHLDHAAGVRSIVAAGATLVVGNGARTFWESTLDAPSTVRPDTLSRSNVTPQIVEVGLDKSLVLVDDGNVKVTTYHTSNFFHAADSLLTVVESNGELYLYEADFYAAGEAEPGEDHISGIVGGYRPLFDAMRTIGIIDESCTSAVPLTIVPAHGFAQSLAAAIAQMERNPREGDSPGCP